MTPREQGRCRLKQQETLRSRVGQAGRQAGPFRRLGLPYCRPVCPSEGGTCLLGRECTATRPVQCVFRTLQWFILLEKRVLLGTVHKS